MFIRQSFSVQQVPCLLVTRVLGERVVRGQANNILNPARDFDRDDVPGIGWNYIDGEKIYLGGRIGSSCSALNCAGIQLASPVAGGFHLHAEKAASGFDDEVVAAAVSPRLDDAQSVLGGARHEKQFYPFSAQLEAAAGGPTFFEH